MRGRPESQGIPHLFPSRRRSGLNPTQRLALQVQRAELLDELEDIDARTRRIADRRLEVLDRLSELRDALWPAVAWQRGRRPGAPRRRSVAPTATDPRPLGGHALRATCLALLEESTGTPVALADLHSRLHQRGYVVASPRPVQALADALGHEHDHGRARRVARGLYVVVGDGRGRAAPASRTSADPGHPSIHDDLDPPSLLRRPP